MKVHIQIQHPFHGRSVAQSRTFPLKEKTPEMIAIEWWKKLRKEMSYFVTFEKVIVDGKEDITEKVRNLDTPFHLDTLLTEKERNWMSEILNEANPSNTMSIYNYEIKTKRERNEKKEIVKKELEDLRKKKTPFSPQELLRLKDKKRKETQGFDHFEGIYIIHNRTKNRYYIGKSESVFSRVYKHFFAKEEGNKGVYQDYRLGDEFSIHFIPLEETSLSELNELEDCAIRAYGSLFPSGYNLNPGNILDRPIFENEDVQKVAEFLLDKIKDTEFFSSLTSKDKSFREIRRLFLKLQLPSHHSFFHNFAEMIKVHKKANKN